MRLSVKVVPGSSRDAIDGWKGDALKVRVAAPPERGRANDALEGLLARVLGVPKREVRVVTGATRARKTVEIYGLSEAEVRRRLAEDGAGERAWPRSPAGLRRGPESFRTRGRF